MMAARVVQLLMMIVSYNKKANNIWRDTVRTAKLTFKMGQGQLSLCQSKADMRHYICGNSNVCRIPVTVYEIVKFNPFAWSLFESMTFIKVGR